MMHRGDAAKSETEPALLGGLDFLWLELTSLCNLECVHCYAESGPFVQKADDLSPERYAELIIEAAALGCRKIQFIGGEPTLHPELPHLIELASEEGYSFIEVYTNATRISDALLAQFLKHKVAVAVSMYADDPAIHDTVTRRRGSHATTVSTLKRLVSAGLSLRVGIVVMDENRERVDETQAFVRTLGIENVGTDRIRSFGRGANIDSGADIRELCGSCWRGSVCVAPNGAVSPCIMSKFLSVGSVREQGLAAVLSSGALRAARARVYDEVWMPGVNRRDTSYAADCDPGCHPNCVPSCNPQCSPNCSPCYPYGKCDPDLFCGPCNP
jgi:MoaA/NifB/PqqE/SkfB family radical SAM enzyme